MILYDMFDEDIDMLPSWQTVDLERCFLNILTHWHQHMVSAKSICELLLYKILDALSTHYYQFLASCKV